MKNLITQIGLVVGAWVTFITTYKDFSDLPAELIPKLKDMEKGPFIVLYFLLLVVCCLIGMFLNMKSVNEESNISQTSAEESKAGNYEKIISSNLKRIELIEKLKIIRSLGFVWVINFILEKKYKIFHVDEFRLPSYWESFPKNHDAEKIIRATIKNERVEIRFKLTEFKILTRSTLKDSSVFGEFSEQSFSMKKFSFLFFICPIYLMKRIIKDLFKSLFNLKKN